MLFYNEYGESAPMRISETDAVVRQKAAAGRKGYIYTNDEEALLDFIVVHWAWKENHCEISGD